MKTATAELRHLVRAESESGVTKYHFQHSTLPIQIPLAGCHRQKVRCDICGAVLDANVFGSRRNSLLRAPLLAVVLATIVAIGWKFREDEWWIPLSLLFGLAPLFTGALLYILFVGASPSARLSGGNPTFRLAGQHEIRLKEAHRPIMWWGFLAVSLLCGAFLGYQYHLQRWGSAIAGDEMVKLIGKPHDGADAQAIFRQLGQLDREEKATSITWTRHQLSIHWKQNGEISRIEFGDDIGHSRYPGELPFALTLEDELSEVIRKLGAATDTSEFHYWQEKATSGHGVLIRFSKPNPYAERRSIGAVIVAEVGWRPKQ